MNTSNQINVDLRPGTRLVRVTRGNREIMWVEDRTPLSGGSGGGIVFAILMVLAFLFLRSSFNEARYDKPNQPSTQGSEANSRER